MKGKYNFRLLPVQKAEVDALVQRRPEYALKQKMNINNLIIKEITERVKGGYNWIVSVFGPTGSGKSYTMLSLVETIAVVAGTEPDINNISCNKDEIVERVETAKRHSVMGLDEQVKGFGTGSTRLDQEIRNMEETLRKKQIHFIFCSPALRMHLHHVVFKTIGGVDRKAGVAKVFTFTPEMDMMGYITLRKPSKWLAGAYEEKKDEFLNRIQKREVSSKKMLKDRAASLLENDDFMAARNKSEQLAVVADLWPDMRVGEHDFILSWARIYQRRKG